MKYTVNVHGPQQCRSAVVPSKICVLEDFDETKMRWLLPSTFVFERETFRSNLQCIVEEYTDENFYQFQVRTDVSSIACNRALLFPNKQCGIHVIREPRVLKKMLTKPCSVVHPNRSDLQIPNRLKCHKCKLHLPISHIAFVKTIWIRTQSLLLL
jgi:hypothetical protein